MNQVELTASVTAIGNALACQLSDDQLELASAVFTLLGDTLAAISVMRGFCAKNNSGALDNANASAKLPANVDSFTADENNDTAETPDQTESESLSISADPKTLQV